MNYSVLYIRLDSYAKHRAKKGLELSEDDLDTTTKKEIVTTIIFTVFILAYPLVVGTVLLSKWQDFRGDVMNTWKYYELFYVTNIIVITILLVISTTLALNHMRKVFGR